MIELGLEGESMEITPSQAAALLGKSERTIVRWIKLGKLPAHQLKDKSYRVKTEDLERFQQQSDETLLAWVEAVEQEVEELERRIETLEHIFLNLA